MGHILNGQVYDYIKAQSFAVARGGSYPYTAGQNIGVMGLVEVEALTIGDARLRIRVKDVAGTVVSEYTSINLVLYGVPEIWVGFTFTVPYTVTVTMDFIGDTTIRDTYSFTISTPLPETPTVMGLTLIGASTPLILVSSMMLRDQVR